MPLNPPSNGEGPTHADGDEQNGQQNPGQTQPGPHLPQSQPRPSPLAPPARFGGARLNFGDFARDGDTRNMRRGLHQYVRKGYGGAGTAVQRFGGTVTTAGALYGALSGGQAATSGRPLDPILLAGRSAREVIDAVIEAVRPADGTQDAEASRAAIRDALSELLTIFPEADLLNLNEDQRSFTIECFVAMDVFRRVLLDIGKTIQGKAPTATVGVARLKEVKNYIKETVAAAFRKLRQTGHRPTKGSVNELVSTALGETFQVFEGYT